MTWRIEDVFRRVVLKRDKLIKHVDLPHLPDNGSLTIQAAVPADQFVPRLSWHKDIVQLVYQVLF